MPLEPIPFGIGWAARDPFGFGGFTPPTPPEGGSTFDSTTTTFDSTTQTFDEDE